VLFALPALLAVGLLHQAQRYFQLPKGYYGLESLFFRPPGIRFFQPPNRLNQGQNRHLLDNQPVL